jgi:formylglycine-generating enzyme required for sulfatase activity
MRDANTTEDDINYTCDFSRNGYRLPTEAEWEFAARNRGVTQGNKHSGYDISTTVGDMAWYSANSNGGTWPVGSKSPNGLGIYDMSGNVREWCWDWHEYWIWYYDLVEGLTLLEGKHYYERCSDYSIANSSAPVVNPAGYEPEEGWPLYNAIRGGSWNSANSRRRPLCAR